MESKRCVGTNGTGQATILSATVLHQTQHNKKAVKPTLHSFSIGLWLSLSLSFEAKTHTHGEGQLLTSLFI